VAQFDGPGGLAYDAAGQRLLVAEVLGNRVRAIQLDDPAHPVSTLVGSAKGYADGPVASALLDRPFALAIDGSRRLYVADGNNRRLRRLDLGAAAPSLETVAGNGEFLKGMIDGPAATAGLNPPKALAIDPAGHVLTSNFDLRVYSPTQGRVRTLAGGLLTGTVDGSVEVALFKMINGIVPAPGGTVLVTDEHRVRLIAHPAEDGVLVP
jgi:sugar lactone lactonase YvrE